MTPTPEQLAAVLPRCSAGLDGGDWTDDDERLAWARRVLRYVEEASRQNTEEDIHAAIVASNDWPPPAKGTHESDLGLGWDYRRYISDRLRGIAKGPRHLRGSLNEHEEARAWSLTEDTK